MVLLVCCLASTAIQSGVSDQFSESMSGSSSWGGGPVEDSSSADGNASGSASWGKISEPPINVHNETANSSWGELSDSPSLKPGAIDAPPNLTEAVMLVETACRKACRSGQMCTQNKHAITCTPCDSNAASTDGHMCRACEGGKEPGTNHSTCQSCPTGHASISGRCVACDAGKIPSAAQDRCVLCLNGTNSAPGASWCSKCAPGRYSYGSTSSKCKPCDAIRLNPHHDVLHSHPSLNDVDGKEVAMAVCPGGARGNSASSFSARRKLKDGDKSGRPAWIMPLGGLWIHLVEVENDEFEAELLPCEACEAASLATFSVDQPYGICRHGFANPSFLCSKCEMGWMKIQGECIECPEVEFSHVWRLISGQGLPVLGRLGIILGAAMILLHLGTHAVISRDEFDSLFSNYDILREGHVTPAKIRSALAMIGISCLDAEGFENTRPKRHNNTFIWSDTQVETFYNSSERSQISKHSFISTENARSPTAAVHILVFFFQTYAIILQNTDFFGLGMGWTYIVNLDIEQAMKSCVTSLSTIELFYAGLVMKLFLLPMMLLLLAWPIWSALRTYLPLVVWRTLRSPPAITWGHMCRALVHMFLFLFAGLTNAALKMVACKRVCEPCGAQENAGACSDCGLVNAFDSSVTCFKNEHSSSAIIAYLIVGLCCVIPCLLCACARNASRRRQTMLAMELNNLDSEYFPACQSARHRGRDRRRNHQSDQTRVGNADGHLRAPNGR